MASVRRAVPPTADRVAAGLTGDLAELMRALKNLIDPYRPEQHYMRGPGPKWRAKHDEAAADAPESAAELVRAKG